MPSNLKSNYIESLWILELYKFTSFMCSLLIWPAFFYQDPNFLSYSIFTSLFLVGNFFMYTGTYGHSTFLKNSGRLPYYYIFQIITLFGMSYAHRTSEFVYLAIIPTLMTMHYFFVVQGGQNEFKQNKSVFMYCAAFCGLLIFDSFKNQKYFNFSEIVAISSFSIWTLSTAYFAFDFYFKGKKRLFTKLFSQGQRNKSNSFKNDKYFFHDLINHIHSMLLFLNHKSDQNKFDKQDINNLINELKLMQENIHGHFGMNHKNLIHTDKFVSFHQAMGRIYGLIDAYFPSSKDVNINFKGVLLDRELEVMKQCKVELVPFHRIMTNILKNAYESGSIQLDCTFDYQEDGIHVVIKNNMSKLIREQMDLDVSLRDVILNFEKKSESIGLESVSEICDSSGGTFEFHINDGQWITTFYLPSELYFSQDKTAA